jgi:hypothetical protein
MIITSTPAMMATVTAADWPWLATSDGHRARRARDLEVGATEHSGNCTGNHGGDESGCCAHAGSNAECQSEGQGHDGDRDASEQIATPSAR